jgi:hypothetical protein
MLRRELLALTAPALLALGSACGMAPQTPRQPPQPVPAAEVLASTSPALPQESDLTLGQNAGSVLIGLTVRPGLPGENTLLLYVLPLEGPGAAATIPVTLSIAGRSATLDTCSRTCRTASATLFGGEHIDVSVGGASGGTASFDVPQLPAVDGTPLLQRVQERMHGLRAYQVDETLGPAQPPLHAAYVFQAPDRMRIDFDTGASTIWIGPTRFRRDAGAAPWQAETTGTSVQIPTFAWDSSTPAAPYIGAHVLGPDTLDGEQMQVLAFFWSAGGSPAWFRLWADGSGLVRRAAMRAQGHFMEHRYRAFDAPVSIEPPAGS